MWRQASTLSILPSEVNGLVLPWPWGYHPFWGRSLDTLPQIIEGLSDLGSPSERDLVKIEVSGLLLKPPAKYGAFTFRGDYLGEAHINQEEGVWLAGSLHDFVPVLGKPDELHSFGVIL